MKRHALVLLVVLVGVSPHLAAQKARWTPPRTADGQPDLQGTWANDVATPLERPKELAGKTLLTDDEVAVFKARARQLFSAEGGDAVFGDTFFDALLANPGKFTSTDGKTGDYNQFWLPERVFEKRTSMIVEPADGRIPAFTPAAQTATAAEAAARRPIPHGPEDRGLSERCLTFGVPRVMPAYMSYSEIVQSRDSVAIVMETIHDTRIIPLDGRPHVGSPVRGLAGDSRGRWEGETLVVDSVGFNDLTWLARGGYFHSDNMRVTERFRREGNVLHYAVTVEDKDVLVEPWTPNPQDLRLNTNPKAFIPEGAPCRDYDSQNLVTKVRH